MIKTKMIPCITPKQFDRFWAYIDKHIGRPCWLWTGELSAKGYGRISFNGQTYRAHRVAYHLRYAGIPTGKLVLHTCDNPSCVNPIHLFTGTAADNKEDSQRKGRTACGERHGLHLHPEAIKKGEELTYSKLTEKDVRRIRDLWGMGAMFIEIAPFFGVHPGTIGHVCHRRTWKHVK